MYELARIVKENKVKEHINLISLALHGKLAIE